MNRPNPALYKARVCLCATVALVVCIRPALAQSGVAAQFGARDPRTCSSRREPSKGAPSGDQLTRYFICDEEKVTKSIASGDLLYLLTDVNVEVGKGRPFDMGTDAWPDVDPSQTVYPIRGRYTSWQCGALGTHGNEPGHSCDKLEQPHAKGICYKDTFADWHCKFSDPGQTSTTNGCPGGGGATSCRLPPPTGK